jgi:hypothetical protein
VEMDGRVADDDTQEAPAARSAFDVMGRCLKTFPSQTFVPPRKAAVGALRSQIFDLLSDGPRGTLAVKAGNLGG